MQHLQLTSTSSSTLSTPINILPVPVSINILPMPLCVWRAVILSTATLLPTRCGGICDIAVCDSICDIAGDVIELSCWCKITLLPLLVVNCSIASSICLQEVSFLIHSLLHIALK